MTATLAEILLCEPACHAAPPQSERVLPALPAPGQTVEAFSTTEPNPNLGKQWWEDERGRSWVEQTRTTHRVRRHADGTLRFYRVVSEMTRGHARIRRNRPRLDDGTFAVEPAKMFCRWSTTYVTIVEPRPSGEWLVKSLTKTPNRPARWTSRLLYGFADTDGNVNGIALDHFERALPHGLADLVASYVGYPARIGTVMPLADHYLATGRHQRSNRDTTTALFEAAGPADFRRRFRGAHTAADLARNLYGTKQVRRDLIKAVATADLNALSWTWHFRGLVPVDWIVTFMRERAALLATADPRRHPPQPLPSAPWMNLYPYLKRLDQRSLKRLLNLQGGGHSYVLRDLMRMPVNPAIRRVDDWRELHDLTADHMRRLGPSGKKRRSRKIALPAEAQALCGPIGPDQVPEGGRGGLRVEFANTETQMWAWGDAMRHCIATYTGSMLSGRGWYGGVYEIAPAGTVDAEGNPVRDLLIGNFEVTITVEYPITTNENGREVRDYDAAPTETLRLTQFLGKRNETLPADVRRTVTALLAAAGIETDTYWGDGRALAV